MRKGGFYFKILFSQSKFVCLLLHCPEWGFPNNIWPKYLPMKFIIRHIIAIYFLVEFYKMSMSETIYKMETRKILSYSYCMRYTCDKLQFIIIRFLKKISLKEVSVTSILFTNFLSLFWCCFWSSRFSLASTFKYQFHIWITLYQNIPLVFKFTTPFYEIYWLF